MIVGGAGTVLGPLFGALVTVLLPEALSGLAEYRLLFFGLTTLVVLWLVPSGLVGSLARLLPRGRDAAVSGGGEGAPLPERGGGEPLVLAGLGIRFGGITAAEGVALTARPGAVTSVIGPNGAGKTTLLNMVSGFYRPSAGRSGWAGATSPGDPRTKSPAPASRAPTRRRACSARSRSPTTSPSASRRGACGAGPGRTTARRRKPSSPSSATGAPSTARPPNCPMSTAASWRSPAPWRAARRSCCWTSPPPASPAPTPTASPP